MSRASRALGPARALFARTASSSSRVGVVDVPRASASPSRSRRRRARVRRARTEASTRSAYGVTDDDAYNVARGEGDEEGDDDARGGRAAVKPTKRKNHIKRMRAREAFTRKTCARIERMNGGTRSSDRRSESSGGARQGRESGR